MSNSIRFDYFTKESLDDFKQNGYYYLYDHIISSQDSFYIDVFRAGDIDVYIKKNSNRIYDTYYEVDTNKLQSYVDSIETCDYNEKCIEELKDFLKVSEDLYKTRGKYLIVDLIVKIIWK